MRKRRDGKKVVQYPIAKLMGTRAPGRTETRTEAACVARQKFARTFSMSWQSYVDDHLIGTGHVTQGAICGVDGSLWAASAGFDVRPLRRVDERWMFCIR